MKKLTYFLSKYNTTKPNEWGVVSKVHLDMGCGANPRNPFGAESLIGVDILDPMNLEFENDFTYLRVDSSGILPLASESVDSISGYDFLEHLPRGSTLDTNLFVKFMNESYRILRKDGVLVLVTPAYPSSAAFQDPTHVNFISDNTVYYFAGKNPLASSLRYGFDGNFTLLTQEWVGPLSFVWAKNPLEILESNKQVMILRFLKSFSSLRKARSMISSLRKPTHLLWVLQKS